MLTTKEAADLTGLTQQHIRHMVRLGRVKAIKSSDMGGRVGRWLIDESSLFAYAKRKASRARCQKCGRPLHLANCGDYGRYACKRCSPSKFR